MTQKHDYYKNLLEEILDLDEHGFPDDAHKKAVEVSQDALREGDEGYHKFFLGESYCLKGQFKEGLRLEAEAIDLLGDVPFVLVNYGVLLSIRGHAKKALIYLDRALVQDSDNIPALAQRGVCLAKLGHFEESLKCFNRILELDPENLHALRNKGVCLSNLFQEDEAMQHFDRVLGIDPNDSHARSEKKILKEDLEMRRTPFGWIAYKIRKNLVPHFRALKLRLFG